jgi:hypothetical protein
MEELLRLLEARDQRDAIVLLLYGKPNEIARDQALDNDFIVLAKNEAWDLVWQTLIIEEDKFYALRVKQSVLRSKVTY